MHKNVLWGMIAVLLITNGLTFVLLKGDGEQTEGEPSRVEGTPSSSVAIVGGNEISYADFIAELEARYGSEMLKEIINQEVVFQMAKKEGIEIDDTEVERELLMMQSSYHDSIDGTSFVNEELWKKEIKYLLLLEELLTKDIVVKETDLQKYYDENQELYQVPQTFHLSEIIVPSKEDVEAVQRELEGGSSFTSLAMERSIDTYTASQGGSLGYVPEDSIREAYVAIVNKLDEGTWSEPIKVEEGYAVVFLHRVNEGKTFSFEEVKDQIRREIAMQQTDNIYTAEPFWSEIGVEWQYGEG